VRPEDLRKRTKAFALDVIAFCDRLPPKPKFQEVGGQLRRAANGVFQNYRAAGRGRSHAEFTAKIGNVLEEADESQGWLELLMEMGATDDRLAALRREADELVAIFTASFHTASRRRKGREENRK
jgi:four helix bundle protein